MSIRIPWQSRRNPRRQATLMSILITLAMSPQALRAQPQGQRGGGAAAAEAHTTPWLRAGSILTGTTHAMVTQQLMKPDKDGKLIDPATGQHFAPGDRPGTSASGWSQSTIAAVEGDKAIVSVSLFADARSMGLADPVPQLNGLSYELTRGGGAPGDSWIDPQRLAVLHNDPAKGIVVLPVSWKIGEKVHDALRILTETPSNFMENVYDRQSGLSLHFFQSTQARPPNLSGPLAADAKNWYVYWGDFVSMREASIPWAAEPMPNAARDLKSLEYTGAITFPGMPLGRPQPYRLEIAAAEHGNGWLKAQVSLLQTGMAAPAKGPMYYGNAQFAGVWAGPEALKKLRVGDVLDEDPITRMKTVISAARPDAVTITRSNASAELVYEYDPRSGLLIASSFYDAISKQRWAMQLARQQ
jgi:hypothetical protein